MRDNPYEIPAALCMVALIGITVFLGEGAVRGLRLLGALVGVLSLPLMFLPIVTLKRHGDVKVGESYMATRRVVDRGLLGVVRHPQYLGYMMLGVSFALLSQRWYSAALALVGGFFFCLHAVKEEGMLAERLSPDYEHYRSRVPRFNIFLGLWRALRGTNGRGSAAE
ncbi:methyltransferase family protein [Gemmatimonadota bacterium]